MPFQREELRPDVTAVPLRVARDTLRGLWLCAYGDCGRPLGSGFTRIA